MFTFSRRPKGLLNLLDAQVQGENPGAFLDEIRGNVDLEKYLLAETLEARQLNGTVTAGGALTLILGTQESDGSRQLVLVRQISMLATFATVGENATLLLQLRTPQGGISGIAGSIAHLLAETKTPLSTIANERHSLVFTPPQPLLIYPPSEIEFTFRDANTVSSTPISASMLAHRFAIAR